MIHSASTGKIDKRTLSNAQRAALGIEPRRYRGPDTEQRRRGLADGTEKQAREMAELNRAILRGEIKPAAERLADQLREMFAGWPEWVRFMNSHRII